VLESSAVVPNWLMEVGQVLGPEAADGIGEGPRRDGREESSGADGTGGMEVVSGGIGLSPRSVVSVESSGIPVLMRAEDEPTAVGVAEEPGAAQTMEIAVILHHRMWSSAPAFRPPSSSQNSASGNASSVAPRGIPGLPTGAVGVMGSGDRSSCAKATG
jgi:hypothetical protein